MKPGFPLTMLDMAAGFTYPDRIIVVVFAVSCMHRTQLTGVLAILPPMHQALSWVSGLPEPSGRNICCHVSGPWLS